ncbi:MAG: hypothetical protein ACRDYC_03570, partial [Acidimicrobiales bacterium]
MQALVGKASRRSSRRWLFSGLVVGAALLIPAATSWACVGLVSLTPSSGSVPPGGTVTLTGKEFVAGAAFPVFIHLDTINGPVIAQAAVTGSTMTSLFSINVTIPADTPVGNHLLIATQAEHNMNGGN